jgi:hypothetical protein
LIDGRLGYFVARRDDAQVVGSGGGRLMFFWNTLYFEAEACTQVLTTTK